MNKQILIAAVGALVSMALATTVPCLLKRTDEPILKEIRKVFETNRQVIIASSIVIGIIIYLSLQIADEIGLDNEELPFRIDPRLFSSRTIPTSIPAGMPGSLRDLLLNRL